MPNPVTSPDTTLNQHAKLFCISYLQNLDTLGEKIIQAVDKLEKDYRRIGLTYHESRFSTRYSNRTPANHQQLREAFEMRTVSQYNLFFALYEEVIQLAQQARQEVIIVGSEFDLFNCCLRVDSYIEKAQDLRHEILAQLLKLHRDVEAIKAIEGELVRQGDGPWWDGEPESKPEWDVFCHWVSLFPETRKLVKAGLGLEKIAYEMLFGGGEEAFVDDEN